MKPKVSTKSRWPGGAAPSRHEPVELSRLVEVDDIPAKGLDLTIHATASECAALAARGGLVAVESLAADFHLRKAKASKVEVVGALRARVVQTCVVSLDPFESDVECPIEVVFAGPVETAVLPPHRRMDLGDFDSVARSRSAELDTPDPIIDGRIDIGALTAEYLMLSLDAYPRKPGVSFDEIGDADAPVEAVSPFAGLKKLEGSFGTDD
jgi:hypothetical protein